MRSQIFRLFFFPCISQPSFCLEIHIPGKNRAKTWNVILRGENLSWSLKPLQFVNLMTIRGQLAPETKYSTVVKSRRPFGPVQRLVRLRGWRSTSFHVSVPGPADFRTPSFLAILTSTLCPFRDFGSSLRSFLQTAKRRLIPYLWAQCPQTTCLLDICQMSIRGLSILIELSSDAKKKFP